MKLVIGISGASGVALAVMMLNWIRQNATIETHVVVSGGARVVLRHECSASLADIADMSTFFYEEEELDATIASGSFLNDGMIVIPCSMKTLSGIAHSYTDNLLIRAADVALKEKRKLVLVTRETPLHEGHLENMLKVARRGAVILPPVICTYHDPDSLGGIMYQIIGKVFDQFSIPHELFRRWKK